MTDSLSACLTIGRQGSAKRSHVGARRWRFRGSGWASWYADWLINLSELPTLLGVKPVRSELVYMLVGLDKRYTGEQPGEPWEPFYARHLIEHFQPSG